MRKIISHLKENWIKYGFETIVIIIGILGAFTLNNWNENRQRSNLEIDNLRALYVDVSKNLFGIKDQISYDSTVASQNTYLLQLLDNKKSHYHDSLASYFGESNMFAVFFPRNIAYNALTSEGIDLISNKILLSNIVDVYDISYTGSQVILDMNKGWNISSMEILLPRFRSAANEDSMIPNNFESLKSDIHYTNWLSSTIRSRNNFLDMLRGILLETQMLQAALKSEIERLDQ